MRTIPNEVAPNWLMTSLLSGLMKISGKLPLASTADTVLPSATARRGRFGEGERGRVGVSDGVPAGEEGDGNERGGCRSPRASEKFYENFRD